MATLQNTIIDTDGHLTIPVGTVAQRPASPVLGMIRLCTDFPGFGGIPAVEFYTGTEWKSLYNLSASGAGGTEATNSGSQYHTFLSGSDTFTVTVG